MFRHIIQKIRVIVQFNGSTSQFRRRVKKPTTKNDFIFPYLKSAKGHVASEKKILGGKKFLKKKQKYNDFIFFNVPPFFRFRGVLKF